MKKSDSNSTLRIAILEIIAVGIAYFLGGMLGLKIASIGSHISLIWAPTGIAIAGLLRFGKFVWIGIWIASCLVNYQIGSSFFLASLIATGNTLGPILAVYFLRKVKFQILFERRKDLLFYSFIVIFAMAVNASVGSLSLYFFGELDFSKLSEAWLFWWLGDAVGAMVVGLPIVSFSREKVIRELKGWKGFENLFVFILVFYLEFLFLVFRPSFLFLYLHFYSFPLFL